MTRAIKATDVKIYGQYIPQKEGLSEEANDYMNNFPCVVVKILDRTDNEEKSLVMSQMTVKLIAIVYDESIHNSGWRDVMNMLSMIRDDLRSDRFIDQRFRVMMPLKSRMVESDTWPLVYGEIELRLESGRKLEPKEYIYRGGMRYGRGIYEGRFHEIRSGG